MLDCLCTLPLTSELFSQATHPTEPILSVGLALGHVQTFRLPSDRTDFLTDTAAATKPSTSAASSITARPNGSANGTHKSLLRSTQPASLNGLDTVVTTWRTRRHTGSCRSVAFSFDGDTLYSAGSDGLCKAASTETGQVTSKVVIPWDPAEHAPDPPSVLRQLSPQALLIGTDSGRVHLFDLRANDAVLPHGSRPAQSWIPHVLPPEESRDESGEADGPINSITPLTPSNTSTSGTSRAWVTTCGPTLAVTDLRKGVVRLSMDQPDELLCSAFVDMHGYVKTGGANAATTERIVTGTADGHLTIWERDNWEDRVASVSLEGTYIQPIQGEEDSTVESIAEIPEALAVRLKRHLSYRSGKMIAVGSGGGVVRLVMLAGRSEAVVGGCVHDPYTQEGVTCLSFDFMNRMISGGGQIVKIWTDKVDVETDEDIGMVGKAPEVQAAADAMSKMNKTWFTLANDQANADVIWDNAMSGYKERKLTGPGVKRPAISNGSEEAAEDDDPDANDSEADSDDREHDAEEDEEESGSEDEDEHGESESDSDEQPRGKRRKVDSAAGKSKKREGNHGIFGSYKLD